MPVQAEKGEKDLRRLRRRVARSQSIGTKVTAEEKAELIHAARADGRLINEWVRDVSLRAARDRVQPADPLMAEIEAIRLLFIYTLEPLLRAGKWSAEQFKEMVRCAKANKHN